MPGLLLLTVAAFGQDINGSITGMVLDHSGSGVPRVKVTLTATERNQVVRTVTTDASGSYSAPLLPIGKYAVTAELRGFKRATQSGITLNVNDQLTVSLKLEVGDIRQEVTVEAAPVAVDLQSPAQSTVVDGEQIRELALVTRNYEELVALMPGVSAGSNADQLYVGYERVDLGLFRSVTFRERYRFQLRGEATNSFNHANPNGFGTALGTNSTFGIITSYRDPRIIQLASKLYF